MWNLVRSTAIVVLLGLATARADATGPDAVRAEARDLLATLIGYQTSEGLGQVPAMVDSLSRRFLAAGFAPEDITVLPHGETASLMVRYRGTGKGGRPVLLLAHMDVVTARAEDWERDPFTLVEENGYFFGRGTADVKAEIALLTETFLRLKAEGFVPSRDLVIALSGDEETTMDTTRELAARARQVFDPEFALNADGGGGLLHGDTGAPQIYYVQGAEKAYATFEIVARNAGGHSSEPRDDNAIYALADALRSLQAYRFPVMWNDWTLGSLRALAAVTPGESGEAMRRFADDPRDGEAANALAAEPSLIGRTRTTCVATMLTGGHAENALPQSAAATVNCRIFPGQSLDDVKSTLQRVAGEKAEVRTVGNPFTSEPSPIREDVMNAVTRAVHAVRPGVPIVTDMAPYATDGSIFRNAGIPTYGVSSQFSKRGDQFSHGLNERISVESFYAGLDHWYVLLKAVAG